MNKSLLVFLASVVGTLSSHASFASINYCTTGSVVTLKRPHFNASAKIIAAGTKAILLESKTRGYADVEIFIAGLDNTTAVSKCELRTETTVLIGANFDSFKECEFSQ